jgi:MFS transporter, ACS family, hexuronate transporter
MLVKTPTGEVRTRGQVSPKTWWICILLSLATALIYLDRQVMALTAVKIIADFSLTKEGFGRVIAAFRYSYGIFQIFGGFLVDAHGPMIVLPAASGLWALSGFLTGLAATVGMLTGFRFLLGAGEAFNWPCALKITNELLPAEDRPLANGIFNAGAPIGAIVAPLVVTVITIRFSWRAAFVVTGAMGGLWVIAWLWYTRRQALQGLKGMPFPLAKMAHTMVRVLSVRAFWILVICAIILNSISYYLSDWIPLYLKTSRGFSFAIANILTIVIYAGTSAGNLLSGLMVRGLVGLGVNVENARRWTLFVSSLLVLSAVAAGFTASRVLAVVLLSLTALGVAGFTVIYLTLVQELDPAYVGITSGLLGGVSNLAYAYVSPYIGRLADLGETWLTLTLIGVLPWLAFLAMAFGVRRPKT